MPLAKKPRKNPTFMSIFWPKKAPREPIWKCPLLKNPVKTILLRAFLMPFAEKAVKTILLRAFLELGAIKMSIHLRYKRLIIRHKQQCRHQYHLKMPYAKKHRKKPNGFSTMMIAPLSRISPVPVACSRCRETSWLDNGWVMRHRIVHPCLFPLPWNLLLR